MSSSLEPDFLQYKVGFLGIPESLYRLVDMPVAVPWTHETLEKLKNLGFNTIQLNVAWGARPGDEPLNLEDVVELSPELDAQYPQVVKLNCRPGTEARETRRTELSHRIALCKEEGLRIVFHFGAPYNAHAVFGDGPPNCLMDPKVLSRYELLLEQFAKDFPGVDDILVYTYDQDAWLCSEFGPCPRCLGIPLSERVVPFLDGLAAKWQQINPKGLLWWEPWELSAGQVYDCVEKMNPAGFALSLHCNIAEVQATLPVDRWLKNTITIAKRRGMPAIVEYWLGGPSEELESFKCLAHPLVTLRGLKAIANVPGVCGIKEYFGLNPTTEDANLRMTGLFFSNPSISEQEALQALAEPYGAAAEAMQEFWLNCSEGMELFPWETAWMIREIGRSRTDHSMSAGTIRGEMCHTPSWDSTRAAIFMKTDSRQPHPWMLEDVQLRCQKAADRWGAALSVGSSIQSSMPEALAEAFQLTMRETAAIRRRALAYAYHLRETNLATILRKAVELQLPKPQHSADELLTMLRADQQNHREEQAAASAGQTVPDWPEMEQAIAALESDVDEFLAKFMTEEPLSASKGIFSVTSR
ncbi:MAG: hypothetical protein ACYC1M_09405 [Armatimonadota bacterium]